MKLSCFTRKCTVVRKVFDSHMRQQIILQLKFKVIFALKQKCYADNKFLEYSGEHAIGYFDCVGFEFLRSEHVQYRARKGRSLVVGGKRECYRDAKKLPKKR